MFRWEPERHTTKTGVKINYTTGVNRGPHHAFYTGVKVVVLISSTPQWCYSNTFGCYFNTLWCYVQTLGCNFNTWVCGPLLTSTGVILTPVLTVHRRYTVYEVYGISALLILTGTTLNSVNAFRPTMWGKWTCRQLRARGGAMNIQRCYVENQKSAISVQSLSWG